MKKEKTDPFSSAAQDADFRDFLFQQLSEMPVDRSMEKICRYVIDRLDGRGYTDSILRVEDCSRARRLAPKYLFSQ